MCFMAYATFAAKCHWLQMYKHDDHRYVVTARTQGAQTIWEYYGCKQLCLQTLTNM